MDNELIAALSNEALLAATRELARRSNDLEADLLVHLGEIDERRLYLGRAFSSMFAFCTSELGFSEGAAYNRIFVARAARRLPALIEAVRTGRVHVTALRLLAPHLTQDNHLELLGRAAGRSKEQVAELAAALAPRPAPATEIRKLPLRRMALTAGAAPPPPPQQPETLAAEATLPPTAALRAELPRSRAPAPQEASVVPIAEDTFKLQLAISREFREEIREAQALLRHRVPDGDLATILRAALGLLVADVKKQRFAVGGNARSQVRSVETESRHVPDALKRAVFERDGGRCTFVSEEGRRCDETGALELDHLAGFARTHRHDLDGLRLLCRAHNQHAADQLYGRSFMDAKRARSGTSSANDEETAAELLQSQ